MQEVAEAKASVTGSVSVKVVEREEATGWVLLVQEVAEAKASVTVSVLVKAVEPEEAIGVAAPEPNVAEATVVTLLRRIK